MVGELPNNLAVLQQQTNYDNWESVRVFSRSLEHFREVRFDTSSNVVISETGREKGHVDVVEVILMLPPEEGADVKPAFAIYDPKSGERLSRYPEAVGFEVEGLLDGSRTPSPDLCLACHTSSHPLLELTPWSESLESAITAARQNGYGIRQTFVDVDSDAHVESIQQLNAKMRNAFPGRVFSLRNWLAQLDEQLED